MLRTVNQIGYSLGRGQKDFALLTLLTFPPQNQETILAGEVSIMLIMLNLTVSTVSGKGNVNNVNLVGKTLPSVETLILFTMLNQKRESLGKKQ